MKDDFRDAVILFIDLANSFYLSKALGFEGYADLLKEYQGIARDILAREIGEPQDQNRFSWAVRGDEASLFLYRNLAADLCTAFHVALQIKWSWFLNASVNRERIGNGQMPHEIGIGIHVGKVVFGRDFPSCRFFKKEGYLQWEMPTPFERAMQTRPLPFKQGTVTRSPGIEGYAINLAKRVESAARGRPYTGIMMSREASELAHKYGLRIEFTKEEDTQVKSFPQPLTVREVITFFPSDSELYSMLCGHMFLGKEQRINMELASQLDLLHEQNPTEFSLGLTLAHLFLNVGEQWRCMNVVRRMRFAARNDPAWLDGLECTLHFLAGYSLCSHIKELSHDESS